jgi:RND family efflux transporter MFP subunit
VPAAVHWRRAVLFGLMPRLARQKTLLAESRADNVHMPVVDVVKVERSKGTNTLELPGNLLALNEAPIYARTDGYVKRRLVDIASQVKQGDLMMELDTPDLDQQIRQAEAAVSQAKASVKQYEASVIHAKATLQLSRITLDRWKRLTAEGVVSKQDEDEKQADYDTKVAEVAAADANVVASRDAVAATEANLKRLQEVKAFARITAPFDGVVNGRFADVGALVTAGSGSSNRELFRLSQIDPMRVYVQVPQTFVGPIRAAGRRSAKITVQQLPGRVFQGTVMDTNASLDPASRTMLTVLYVPNPKSELLPGMFAYVTFSLNETLRPLVVPGDTIMSKTDGPHVAVVGAGGRVQFRRIEPGRDFGSRMEVLNGVSEGETLVINPTDEVREGGQVQVRTAR